MAMLKGIVLLFLVMVIFVDTPWGCLPPGSCPQPEPQPEPQPGEVCCSGRTCGRQEPPRRPYNSGISPAICPYSTVCYYHRTSKCLTCTTPTTQIQCCTKEPNWFDPEMPLTEYLIHLRGGEIYLLSPLSGGSYSDMNRENESSRLSIRKDTCPGKGVAVRDSNCWEEIKDVIDAGSLFYYGTSLRGFLYVTNE